LGGYSYLKNGMKTTVWDGDGKVLGPGTMEDQYGNCSFRDTLQVAHAEHWPDRGWQPKAIHGLRV
jgi:hypothetical protein